MPAVLAADTAMPTFSLPIRVYWEDTDAGGIVFYANYLKFFERARTEWLRSLGWNQQQLRDTDGGMFVVTHAQLEYLRPARLDDVLHVTAKLEAAGRASLTLAQQAFLQPLSADSAAQLLCQGSVRLGWIDATSLRPARIPSSLIEQLSSLP